MLYYYNEVRYTCHFLSNDVIVVVEVVVELLSSCAFATLIIVETMDIIDNDNSNYCHNDDDNLLFDRISCLQFSTIMLVHWSQNGL